MLTIDIWHFTELSTWIERMSEEYHLNITNVGNREHKQVQKFYSQAGALIYPSMMESFGLPLIEARYSSGLTIKIEVIRDVTSFLRFWRSLKLPINAKTRVK